MVWCWQQDTDNRPKADEIIVAANNEQFLKLFDGIRASNGGQVYTQVHAVTIAVIYVGKENEMVQ